MSTLVNKSNSFFFILLYLDKFLDFLQEIRHDSLVAIPFKIFIRFFLLLVDV